MKTVVVTGSTRGLGHGLAEAFLARGCRVVVSGRAEAAVAAAVAGLADRCGPEQVAGWACDVTNAEQVRRLWEEARLRFGQVDIWINNAGSAARRGPLVEQPESAIAQVVGTNLVGAMYGAQVALRGMLEQGHGAIYVMEGLGSDGRTVPGLTLYGSSKHGLRYFWKALAREARGTGVLVGALSPGMVATDMLTGLYEGQPAEWRRARRIFNILADPVEPVAAWLAEQVLANQRNGALLAWLTRRKILARLLLAPWRKRDVFHGWAPTPAPRAEQELR